MIGLDRDFHREIWSFENDFCIRSRDWIIGRNDRVSSFLVIRSLAREI